jgi:hypothetical protein
LIALGHIDDADFGKFKTTLAEALQYIKYSKDTVALERLLRSNREFQSLDREAYSKLL